MDDLIPVGMASWLRRQLLAWFNRHQRDLPWRHTLDPYPIWVSEVMLQQTQVATVIPFFQRFLARFPTLVALAAADEQEVLHLWEGLGYYRRARDLHRAARCLVADHQGQFPRDLEALRRLPGLGRYMVGAILSQAFDRPLPIVEANSQRVLCRLFGIQTDPRQGPTQRRLWELAAALLPRQRVGTFNQALMELGALVCLAGTPHCGACPLSKQCLAYQQNLQETIPVKAPRPPTSAVEEVAVVLRRGRRVLLVQRPKQGRWACLWEFPHLERGQKESLEQTALRVVHDLTHLRARVGLLLGTVKHSVTRFRIQLACLEAQYLKGKFASTFYTQGQWLEPEQLSLYPVSSPQRRLIQVVVERGGA